MTRRTAPVPAPRPALGSIHADEVLPLKLAAARLGLATRARRQAVREGLRIVTFAKRQYVLGRDVLEWFTRLAERQAVDNGRETKV